MKNRTVKHEPLKRRPYVDRLRAQIIADLIRDAGIEGDPDEYGTDAYLFADKPHRFIRELYERRNVKTALRAFVDYSEEKYPGITGLRAIEELIEPFAALMEGK